MRLRVVMVRTGSLSALIIAFAILSLGGLYLRGVGLEVSTSPSQVAQPVTSLSLVGVVVVVDPGHGGVDPGAVGLGGTLEKDLTLAIAKKVAIFLEQSGARAILTRGGDNDLADSGQNLAERKRQDLKARLDLARKEGAQIYVSIQANAFESRWTGAQTFFNPESEESKRLATSIQAELRQVLRNTNRVARPLDAYVLRELSIPVAMVETGFISNPAEERLLNDPSYQEKLAWAILRGIVRFLSEPSRGDSLTGKTS